ncbi:MAG: hypothetical protein U0169_25535 [Polyangiaceae bacterium]
MTSAVLPLASYKLRFVERHLRIVPKTDAEGCAFAGPGVDVRGDDADRAFELAAPVVLWLVERDPTARVRSIACDRAKMRFLVTLHASPKPMAVRIEAPASHDLDDRARDLVVELGRLAALRLAARRA